MGVWGVNSIKLWGGFFLSVGIGVLGYRRGALNRSGVLGAILTGTLIFGWGGWDWGLLLIAFFVSSSFLSFYRAGDKVGLAEKFSKGHRRDWGQALANGGLAALLAICSVLWPDSLWFIAAAGALAAVNADTWATELGVLSRRAPRLITTGRPVEVGTSGGITGQGTLATVGGAFFIGGMGTLATWVGGADAASGGRILLAATVGGVVGSLFDSLMGATVQAIYWCDTCQKETERRIHRCGSETRQVRGLSWMNNDVVNFLASLAGAASAAGIGALWQ